MFRFLKERLQWSVLTIILLQSLIAFSQKPFAPPTEARPLALRQAHFADISQKISRLINEGDAARGFWGIQVVSLATGETVYEQNPDKLFAPASNAKLFTTITALASLGPDFRERTTVESVSAPDRSGRLAGDLILVGRGDANLSGRVLPYSVKTERTTPSLNILEDLADQVARKGIKTIAGDIVGDDTYFAYERFGEGWSQDDLLWDYGAPVVALTVNDNVIFANIFPGATIGEKARIEFEPDSAYYQVDNQIVTTARASGPRNISIDRQLGSHLLSLWGTIPLNDTGDHEALAIDDPADFAARAFSLMLEARGIKIIGKPRADHLLLVNLPVTPVTPTVSSAKTSIPAVGSRGNFVPSYVGGTILASHDSPPLAEDLQVTNKVSQNLHAELALRLVGHEKGNAPTVEEALRVEKRFLAEAGIGPEEFALFDGSGLSRQDLVTPRSIVKLLQFADFPSGWRSAFRATLPVAGYDGSLSERMKGTPAEGRVWAKTGTLGHVNALSGYALTLNGEPLAFSILCNNHKLTSHGATRIMDEIAEGLVDDSTAPAKN